MQEEDEGGVLLLLLLEGWFLVLGSPPFTELGRLPSAAGALVCKGRWILPQGLGMRQGTRGWCREAELARPLFSMGYPLHPPQKSWRLGRQEGFYLRRAAASSGEGMVQAARGQAPLSPMEGV